MRIFFAGSIRGGRAEQPTYAHIVKELEKYGEVYSQFVHDQSLSHYGETSLTDDEIYNREIQALQTCDMLVADVTAPSLGVGYLIAEAVHTKKRILALYRGEDTLKLSAMIKGNPDVTVLKYTSTQDLGAILSSKI